jgi:hypothetical protein
MNRLQSEWQRLYLAHSPESTPQASSTDSPASAPTQPTPGDAMTEPAADSPPGLVTPGGRVRALVLELGRPADWDALLAVWQGVQADLALPAPAIAVSGTDAYQLWFSVAQAVPVAQAAAFLEGLRQRHLADVAPHRIGMLPAPVPAPVPAASAPPALRSLPPALRVPAQQPNGHWSAFVTADLARIFADEPWLDLPPNELAQADLLSRMVSIPLDDFERACAQLRPSPPAPAPAAHTPTPDLHPQAAETAQAPAAPHVSSATGFMHSTAPTTAGGPWTDPRDFLLHVMNDASVDLRLRMEAARALLPPITR